MTIPVWQHWMPCPPVKPAVCNAESVTCYISIWSRRCHWLAYTSIYETRSMNFCPPCDISRSHIGDILGSDAYVVTWMYTKMSGEPVASMAMAEANSRFLRNVRYPVTKLQSVIPQVMYFSSKLPHKDISPPNPAHISFRHHPRRITQHHLNCITVRFLST